MWHLDDAEPRIILAPDQLEFANELKSGATLLYGYPMYIEAAQTAIPVFTWPIDYELHGSQELWLRPIPKWPQLNPEYLKRFASKPEEQRGILNSLGLLDVIDDPPDGLIVDLLERMKEMGLLPDVQEPLEPRNLASVLKKSGVSNCAALFLTEGPQFTAGLIRDLKEMIQKDAPEWKTTALGTMFGEGGVDEDNQPAIEIAPLNEEQRKAFQTAISSPLTVITGPPGTGKSQIVVSLIADSYLHNRRVLFTSKNHKAVDVVDERVAKLTTNPLMIRTGKSFFVQLAQRLESMLALQPSGDDRRKYSELEKRYKDLRIQENELWEELQRIRNANDDLSALDGAKTSFKELYTPHEWEGLQKEETPPDRKELEEARQLADLHVADSDIPFSCFSHLPSVSYKITKAMKLVDKHSASSNMRVNDFSDLQSASNRLTKALKLVDKHIKLLMGSPTHSLTTASRLAYRHVKRSGMPANYHASLTSLSCTLRTALELADKHVIGSDTLPSSFSLWRSKKKDRRQIQSIAFKVAAEFRVLGACPSEDQSFQSWRTWLLQALQVIDTLKDIAKDRDQVQSMVTDTVAEYSVFDPCPTEGQSFRKWRAWLIKALAVVEELETIDKDHKQILSIAADMRAECPILDSGPTEDQSFGVWQSWFLLASDVVRKLEAIHEDRKRIQNVAAAAVTNCPALGPCPMEEASFQEWRTWLVRALSIVEALEAIAAYRSGLARLSEMRSRDEVARHLRRVLDSIVDSGAKLVALYARLAPDRLKPEDRQSIGNLRALLKQLHEGEMENEYASTSRKNMIHLFRDGSRHLPAWSVTNLSARNSLPLEPNLFDLLVIDEASQCDIASAIPLLYRSKRVAIIGDPFQLRHITRVEQGRDNQLQATHGLGIDDLRFTYSNNSLYDLSMTMGTLIQLQDHYRSHKDIAAFSNHEWYDDTLRIWTNYAGLKRPPDEYAGLKLSPNGGTGICWTEVSGTITRPQEGSVFIQSEVEEVVEQLIDLLMNHGFDGTVGVVTPFRAQANKISERVAERIPEDVRNRAQLIIDTAHGFQGDERDIILFSPCVSLDLPPGSQNFLKDTGNLFNVAITRARSLLHVVGSREACSNSEIPHIQRFAEYCKKIEGSVSSPYETTLASDDHVGPWERPLYDALVAKGLHPMPQYRVHQYRLDMAIICNEIRIDVEADGVATHLNSRRDAERDSRLTELGWRVIRFWNHQIRDDLDCCVETVLKAIARSARSSP